MKIGIDATALPPQPVGAGNYIIQLIRALAELDEEASYTIFVQPHGRELIGLAEQHNLKIEQVGEMSPGEAQRRGAFAFSALYHAAAAAGQAGRDAA